MIYLDANATTPIAPAVLEAMLPFLRDQHANPSASYAAARQVRRAVDVARGAVAGLLAAEPGEIIFTSGATESMHTTHHSVRALWPEKRRLITTAVEHAAGLECAARWKKSGGEVCLIGVDSQGRIDLAALESALRNEEAALVSVLWANNETGVIQPLHEVVELAHAHGALVHADAVQMPGKAKIHVREVPVDFLSLSGHKFHAPKGVGILYVSQRVRFEPLLTGGGQEGGRRSGTENVAGIVALGKAAELAQKPMDGTLRDAFERDLRARWPEAVIHGQGAVRLPNTSSVHLPGVDAAGMLIILDQRGLACSAGSACHAGAVHPSHVLEAMGFDAEHAAETLRISFSRMNSPEEATTGAQIVAECAERLRSLRGSACVV